MLVRASGIRRLAFTIGTLTTCIPKTTLTRETRQDLLDSQHDLSSILECMGRSIATPIPLRLRLWLGRRLYGPLGFGVVRVSRDRIIKRTCGPQEVEAMQYIASNTSIPIPRLHKIHTPQNGEIFIEMEYVHGETLDKVWRTDGRLSPDQKSAILAEIKDYVAVLRGLEPPEGDLVASAYNNPVYDARIGARYFGRFSHRYFQSLTRRHLVMEDVEQVFGKDVAAMHTKSYRTCFTHADMVPRNIIVRDGHVLAIIDWGFSGWYPEYWEYTKGHFDFFPKPDWLEYFRQAVPRYDMELLAEQMLWEILPDVGTLAIRHRNGVERRMPGSRPSTAWLAAREGRDIKDLWSVALSSSRYSGHPE